jgi:hypothetical protein
LFGSRPIDVPAPEKNRVKNTVAGVIRDSFAAAVLYARTQVR